MEKLIVKPSDLIMVNVTNVDLDYAVKGKNLKQFSTLSILEASRVLVVFSFWKKKNNNKKQTDQNVREQPRGWFKDIDFIGKTNFIDPVMVPSKYWIWKLKLWRLELTSPSFMLRKKFEY